MKRQTELLKMSDYHQVPQAEPQETGTQLGFNLNQPPQLSLLDLAQPTPEAEQSGYCWYCPECQASSDDDGA